LPSAITASSHPSAPRREKEHFLRSAVVSGDVNAKKDLGEFLIGDGRWKEAMPILRELVALGHPEGEYLLGCAQLKQGLSSVTESLELIRTSARKGVPGAAVSAALGIMQRRAAGYERDARRMLRLFARNNSTTRDGANHHADVAELWARLRDPRRAARSARLALMHGEDDHSDGGVDLYGLISGVETLCALRLVKLLGVYKPLWAGE
jgi:hypothetical protein